MGMKAFHAVAGSADAARRPRPPVLRWHSRVAEYLVAAMGRLEIGGVDRRFGGPDPTGRLEPADRVPLGPAHEPVQRRHGCAVVEKR